MRSHEQTVTHNQEVNMLCVEFATHLTVYQLCEHVLFHVCFSNFFFNLNVCFSVFYTMCCLIMVLFYRQIRKQT